jgi:hypothetical protein
MVIFCQIAGPYLSCVWYGVRGYLLLCREATRSKHHLAPCRPVSPTVPLPLSESRAKPQASLEAKLDWMVSKLWKFVSGMSYTVRSTIRSREHNRCQLALVTMALLGPRPCSFLPFGFEASLVRRRMLCPRGVGLQDAHQLLLLRTY